MDNLENLLSVDENMATVHSAPDEFSSGEKFMCFGIPFTQNHKNQTLCRSNFRVNRVKILNGRVKMKYPVKF